MDLKSLLNKLDIIEGSMKSAAKKPLGPKYPGYWRGQDAGPPGNKLVGMEESQPSILKTLQKQPKTLTQQLEEEYRDFLTNLEEENLGTHPKRGTRSGSRHPRGHEPQPGFARGKDKEVSEQTPAPGAPATTPPSGQAPTTGTTANTASTGTTVNPQQAAKEKMALGNLKNALKLPQSTDQLAMAMDTMQQGSAPQAMQKAGSGIVGAVDKVLSSGNAGMVQQLTGLLQKASKLPGQS